MIAKHCQEDGRICVIGCGLVLGRPQTMVFPRMKKCSFAVIVSAKRISKTEDYLRTIVRLTVYFNKTLENAFRLAETLRYNERVSFKGIEVTQMYKDPVTKEEKTTVEIRVEELVAIERLAGLMCANYDMTTETRTVDPAKTPIAEVGEEDYLF